MGFGQITVTPGGNAGEAQTLIAAGDGPVLLFNNDANNSVWLGDDPFGTNAGDVTGAAPLPPGASASFDGETAVYGVTPSGQTALVSRFPGGRNFFQLTELLVKTLLISGSAGNGLYDYSPSPGLGALVASISQSLVDPFGNQVHPGISAYGSGGAPIGTLGPSGLSFLDGSAHLIGSLAVDSPNQFLALAGAFYPLVVESLLGLKTTVGAPTGLSGAAQLGVSAGGHLVYSADTALDTNTYATGKVGAIYTGAPQTFSSTTPVTLGNLSVNLGVGQWLIRGKVKAVQAATAGIEAIRLTASGGLVASLCEVDFLSSNSGSLSSTLSEWGIISGLGSDMSTTVSMTGGFSWDFLWQGVVVVSTAGTMSVQGRIITASTTWSGRAGSYLVAEPLS